MRQIDEFKEGDTVWCAVYGQGEIAEIDPKLKYPVTVYFHDGKNASHASYTLDGKLGLRGQRVLYFAPPKVDGETTRPYNEDPMLNGRYGTIVSASHGQAPAQAAPVDAIASILNEVMEIAVSNGANSVSMPDHYVEVAAWLAATPATRAADSVLEDAALLWEAFIEAWRNEIGVDKIVNIMGGADKLKAVFLDAARAQADSVLEDAARLDFLIEQQASVVSDPDACPGYWLHFLDKETGKCWAQIDEHPTPRAAIDAARKQGANHD